MNPKNNARDDPSARTLTVMITPVANTCLLMHAIARVRARTAIISPLFYMLTRLLMRLLRRHVNYKPLLLSLYDENKWT